MVCKNEQFILLILQIKDNLFNETFLDKGSTAFIINLQTKCFFFLQCEICQGEIKGTDLSAHPVDCLDMFHKFCLREWLKVHTYIQTYMHACIHYKASHKALQVKLIKLGLLIDY